MDPNPLTSVADLVEIAGKLPPSNVVVPGGHRLEDLKLVEAARDHGIVDHIILVGDRRAISRSIAELGIKIRPDRIIPAVGAEAAAAATARLVTEGRADIVLKGDISTPVINRALKPLAVRPTVSLATVFDAAPISAGRPMVLTDAGFTTVCSFGRMVDLVENACEVARLVLGIPRPRVAILSANEKPIPSLPSTWLGEKLSERTWEEATVYGPLSFDLATDPESVALKGLDGPPAARAVAGRADVLVCPGIDTANALYKTITALNKFGLASLAGITVGFPFPYVILSRADTLETRLESIALCSVFVQRRRRVRTRRRQSARASVSAARILAILPWEGSVKVAVFSRGKPLRTGEAGPDRPADSPAPAAAVAEKTAGRILRMVRGWGIRRIDAVAVPAGSLSPAPKTNPDGVYRVASLRKGTVLVDEELAAARPGKGSRQSENFGISLAAGLARLCRAPAYAVDPVGGGPRPEIAFSLKAVARLAAAGMLRPPSEVKLVVAGLGREIAVAVLKEGKFFLSAIRPGAAGRSPSGPGEEAPREAVIELAAREIGAGFVAAGCDVEAIVLSGEGGGDREVLSGIRRRVSRLAPVVVLEGNPGLERLASAAAGVISGRIRPAAYRSARRRSK